MPVTDFQMKFDTEYSPRLREECVCATHRSGLEIRVISKPTASCAAVLATRYGALDECFEWDGRWMTTPRGVAHFLEHQVFSSENGEIDEQFARLGAEVNAFTSHDRTAYTLSCTDHICEALEQLIHMVIHPVFDPASVERERSIIAEEIRMNRDNPWERCYANLLGGMYIKHGLRQEICGDEESLAAITPEVLSLCHAAFYRPSNMVLCVSGPVTAEEVFRVVETAFEGLSDAVSCIPARRYPKEPPAGGNRYVTQSMPHIDEKAVFCIGIKGRTLPEDARSLLKKDLVMTILSDMLFSRSAPFYNELFEEGLIAPGYSNDTSLGRTWALYTLTGEADEPDCVFQRFLDYVEQLRRDGFSDEDFERSRRVLYADFVTGFDSPEDIVQSLVNDALDGVSVFDFLTVFDEITMEDVKKEFCENFCPDAYTLSVIAAGEGMTDTIYNNKEDEYVCR